MKNTNALNELIGIIGMSGKFKVQADCAASLAQRMLPVPFDPWLEIASMNPWCVCR